jgi:hypothetical protein
MPFPATLEDFYRAGYVFLRGDRCSECGSEVHVFRTPGGREIVMEPNFDTKAPATRHYERCQPKQEEQSGSQRNDVQDAKGRDSDSSDGGDTGPQVQLQDGGGDGLHVRGRDAQSAGVQDKRILVGFSKSVLDLPEKVIDYPPTEALDNPCHEWFDFLETGPKVKEIIP